MRACQKACASNSRRWATTCGSQRRGERAGFFRELPGGVGDGEVTLLTLYRIASCGAQLHHHFRRPDMAANKKTTKNRLRNDQPPPEANGVPADASTPTRKTAASRKPKSTKAQKHA